MTPCNTTTLANGLRIIHHPSPTSVVYCGYAIDAGTRDEQPHEAGLAHFVEHMLFKGTTKRRAWHILNRMENVGGDLNAYTNKEETVIYSAFLKKDFTRALELLTDIVFHSTFPQHEMDKERGVILEEIDCYRDNPAELIFDDFEEILFSGHALGHNILGTPRHVGRFTRPMPAALSTATITPPMPSSSSMATSPSPASSCGPSASRQTSPRAVPTRAARHLHPTRPAESSRRATPIRPT